MRRIILLAFICLWAGNSFGFNRGAYNSPAFNSAGFRCPGFNSLINCNGTTTGGGGGGSIPLFAFQDDSGHYINDDASHYIIAG